MARQNTKNKKNAAVHAGKLYGLITFGKGITQHKKNMGPGSASPSCSVGVRTAP